MKTAMKKLFSLMLVAVLLVGVMPFQAFAATEPTIDTSAVRATVNGVPVDEDTLVPQGTYSAAQILDMVNFDGNIEGCSIAINYNWANAYDMTATNIWVPGNSYLCVQITPAAEPDVCDKCGEEHKTDDCTKVQCTVCNSWTDHNAAAHCGYKGCTARDHVANDHCTTCDALKSVCPVTCPGNADYVEPTPDPATVAIIINNNGTGKSFTVEAGKNTNGVYAAFQASAYAAQFEGAHGPILTLADSSTPVAATESGKTYWLWLSLDNSVDEPADDPVDPPTDPEIPEMCEFCYADKGQCVTCETCGKCVKEGDHKACNKEDHKGQVKVYLNLNYAGAYGFGEKMDYVWANRNALLKDVVASVPAPERDKHKFQYWTTDQAGTDIIDSSNREARATADGIVIYAQWADDVQAANGKITLHISLNYDHKMGEPVRNIAWGTRMGSILENIKEPTRWNHKFIGWYWDSDCTDAVESGDRIYKDDVIFAKWDKRNTNNEIMLKIYLNGNTASVAKIVDMYEYSEDGEISMSEVKEVVKKYYTARNSDGMSYKGLFDSIGWSAYVSNLRHNGTDGINVHKFDDTTVYVMVHNAKIRTDSASSSADSSNPKTGDMIMTPVMVMGVSVSALAVLFYLNKKRAV